MDANTVSPLTPLHIAFKDGGQHVRAVVDEGKVVGILLMRHLLEQTAAGRDIQQLAARDVMQSDIISTERFNNGLHIARLFHEHRMKSLILTDQHGHFVRHMIAEEAIATLPTSLFGFFQPVSQIMIRQPKSTSADTWMREVIETWLLTPLSCLLVCNANDEAIGMLSESDVLRWILSGKPEDAKVADYMVAPVVTMNKQDFVYDVWHRMQSEDISKMVLLDDANKLVGLLTATDILVALCHSQLDTFAQFHCPEEMDMALEWSKDGMVMAVKDSIIQRFGWEKDELVGLHWREGCDDEVVHRLLNLKRSESMDVLWEIDGAVLPFVATRDSEQAVMWWRLQA